MPPTLDTQDSTPLPSLTSSRAIILCEGDQGRLWNLKTPKQLVQFNGQPLLERTIEMLRARGVKDILINGKNEKPWWKFCKQQDLPLLLEPDKKPDQDFLAVLVQFREHWNATANTIWVYGDVVFSQRMMDELCKPRDNDIFFATRFSPTKAVNTWRAEIFGWNMRPNFHAELDTFLRIRKMSPYHKATDVWSMFHFLMDRRDANPSDADFIDAGEDDYTLDLDYEGDMNDLGVLAMLAQDDDRDRSNV